MLRRRSDWVAVGLAVSISLPAFVLGRQLREGEPSAAMLALMVLILVVIASAIMKQFE